MSAELPKNLRELRKLLKEIAPEATLRRAGGGLLLEGEETGFVFTFELGHLCFDELVEELEDDDGAPTAAPGETGQIASAAHLARVVGWALGLRSVVDYVTDPLAYLRERAEAGVGRG